MVVELPARILENMMKKFLMFYMPGEICNKYASCFMNSKFLSI
jgi:hypothetical protein